MGANEAARRSGATAIDSGSDDGSDAFVAPRRADRQMFKSSDEDADSDDWQPRAAAAPARGRALGSKPMAQEEDDEEFF